VRINQGLGKLTLVGLGLLVLSSCAVVVDEGPRPLPPRPGGPQACTMEYNPVCGERGGRQQTFGNSCSARAQGFRVVHGGECRSQWRPPVPPRPAPPQSQACTREFRPVCGQRGNTLQTFPNACEAGRANFRVAHPGECRPVRGR